jgi:hypothetical protein
LKALPEAISCLQDFPSLLASPALSRVFVDVFVLLSEHQQYDYVQLTMGLSFIIGFHAANYTSDFLY